MKSTKSIAFATVAALALSSCSTIKEKYLVITGRQGSEMTATATPVGSDDASDKDDSSDRSGSTAPSAAAAPGSSAEAAPKKNENKKGGSKKGSGTTATAAAPKKDKAKPIGTAIDGQWNVAEVGSTKIELEEDVPYVTFDCAAGRVYAFNGCNYLNGSYTLTESNKLSFGQLLSTLKYCADTPFDSEINAVITEGVTLSAEIKRIGQESYLYLRSPKGNTLMTLRRHNMEFLNGNWLVTSIEGKRIDDEEANVFFDIHELKIHGNTGCNFFNGEIYIDPNRSNAIDFSRMGVTRMACPKTAQETAMLVALESTASAIAGRHESTVLLLDKNGRELMTLRRIPRSE